MSTEEYAATISGDEAAAPTLIRSMKIDECLYVDFGREPAGPARTHEMRYPGADVTSEIWILSNHSLPKVGEEVYSCTRELQTSGSRRN